MARNGRKKGHLIVLFIFTQTIVNVYSHRKKYLTLRFWTRPNYFGHVQNVLNRTKNNQKTGYSRQITNLSFNQGL